MMEEHDTEAARIERGRQGWATIKKSADKWDEWTPTNDALGILSSNAMRLAETNKRTGRKYATIFGKMLVQHELDDIPPTTRAAAIKCAKFPEFIAQHRAQMLRDNPAKFLKLSHPQAVWAEIRPLVMTDVEKQEAQRKKNDRKLAKEAAAQEADADKINISRMDADDIAEELHTKLPDQDTVRRTIKRLLALTAPNAVILVGDERPEELARILNDEVKPKKQNAETLCTNLLAFHQSDGEQDATAVHPTSTNLNYADPAVLDVLSDHFRALEGPPKATPVPTSERDIPDPVQSVDSALHAPSGGKPVPGNRNLPLGTELSGGGDTTPAPDTEPTSVPGRTAASDDRMNYLLTTPVSEVDIRLPAVDDQEFAELTGDAADIEAASLIRRRVFEIVAALSEFQFTPVNAITDHLRHRRSAKLWIVHGTCPLTLIMDAAEKEVRKRRQTS